MTKRAMVLVKMQGWLVVDDDGAHVVFPDGGAVFVHGPSMGFATHGLLMEGVEAVRLDLPQDYKEPMADMIDGLNNSS